MNLYCKTMTFPERVTENEQVKIPTWGHQSPEWPDIIALKKKRWRILYHLGIPEKGNNEQT